MLEKNLKNLALGDHLCFLYETESEHQALFAPFLRHGIELGEKIIYVTSDHTKEEVINYLRDGGLDENPYLENGQLEFVAADDVYTRGGFFDPDRMIDLLRKKMEQAFNDGYPAIRSTGEMSWAIKDPSCFGRLVEYESRLNEFLPNNNWLAICQYDRRKFEPEFLLQILITHPIAVLGTDIVDNFYYLPPLMFSNIDIGAKRLETWINILSKHARIGNDIVASKERFQYLLSSSPAVVYTAKTSGDYETTFISENVTRMAGYEPSEIVEDPNFWFDHVHPDDKLKIKNQLGRLYKENICNYEYRFRCKDGSCIWIYDGMRLIRDKTGEPLEIVGCRIDITERNEKKKSFVSTV